MNTTNKQKLITSVVVSTLLFIVLATAINALNFSTQFTNLTLDDAYISSDEPSVNQGAHINYYLGTYGSSYIYETLIKFETNNFNLSYGSIESATLSIKKTLTIGQGCDDLIAAYLIIRPWSEFNVTWINATNNATSTTMWNTPGLGADSDYNSTILSLTSCNLPGVPDYGWCVIDITNAMARLLSTNGGNGILLKPYNPTYAGSTNRYCQFASSDTQNSLNATILNITYSVPGNLTESEAQPVILQAINSIIPSSTKYNYQQAYLVNAIGNQTYATWDYYVLYNTKRWAINYVTAGEQFVNAANLTPNVYVLETANKTNDQLRAIVETFLNTTQN